MTEHRERITALTGVYHAHGGLVGELRYVVGKLRGTAHCALCDITHGRTGKKAGFAACEAQLPVPLSLVHLNEQSIELARHTAGATPCVVAHTGAGLRTLMDAARLNALGGSVRAFEQALRDAVEREKLAW